MLPFDHSPRWWLLPLQRRFRGRASLKDITPAFVLCAALAATGFVGVAPRAALADTWCSTPEGDREEFVPIIPAADTLRALVVFARFPDSDSLPQCETTSSGWTDPDVLPAWADTSIIEDKDVPTNPGSLTHFYSVMSQGVHIIKGTVYPTVVETPDSLKNYVALYGNGPAMWAANTDVIDLVAADMDTELRQYDEDQDGTLDWIFIHYWSHRSSANGVYLYSEGFGGIARVLAEGTSKTLTFSDQSTLTVAFNHGATTTAARHKDQGQPVIRVHTRNAFVGTAAHEYGHAVLSHHIPTLDVYGIMDGTSDEDTWTWGAIVSAYNRRKVGWIEPLVVDSLVTARDTTIVLKDAATQGDAGYAIVKTRDRSGQYFILECRNAEKSPYLRADTTGTCPPRPQAGSGLVVTHVAPLEANKESYGFLDSSCDVIPYSPTNPAPRVDIEVATGMFDTTTALPDPVRGFDELNRYECWSPAQYTDLFQNSPGDPCFSNVFAPYTNPSTDLYADSTIYGGYAMRRQDVYSGISIYNIHWANAGKDSMYVSIRFDGGVTPHAADTLRATTTTWDGLVQVTGDLVVAEGATLTATANARVYAAANTDRRQAGKDTTRTELGVRGKLEINGEAMSPTVFSSSRDEDYFHFPLGNRPPPAPGDWYGLRFDLVGCGPAGDDGYVGCVQPLSSVKNARIESGSYGIVIEDNGTPRLEGVDFANIQGNRHIFLEADAVLGQGYWVGGSCGDSTFQFVPGGWNLRSGTHVIASTSTFDDAWIGSADKNDIIAYAKIFTDRTGARGVSVFFGPSDTTNVALDTAGADWGGFLFAPSSSGSHLRWASIGYAEIPVFMYYPDSLTAIERSTIHHFADTGVWIQGSQGSGAYLDSCVVDRGSDLEASLGGTGIFLDKADEVNVLSSRILLLGRDDDEGAAGIVIGWGKTFCETTPLASRSLLVQDNLVVGPGRGVPQAGDEYTGIQAAWVCGSNDRDIDILKNMVAGFKYAGLEFVQTADVQVNCNFLWQNRRGVDVYRDSEPTGTSIRFKENKLEATEAESTFFALRTTDASKVKLGPSQSDRGHNRLKVNTNLTKFISEVDSNGGHVLDATNNFWYAEALLSDSASVKSRYAPAGWSITFWPFGGDDSSIPTNCWQDTTLAASLLSGSVAMHGLVAAGEYDALAAPDLAAPTVLELGKPFPNPNRSGATLSLAVPEGRIGQYVAQVFDVRGRRVWESRQAVDRGGRYRLVWEGRDSSNREVAAGVYFLRLSGPGGFVETRKITILR